MNLTALRRPHEFGRTTMQFIPVTGSRRGPAGLRAAPGEIRLIGRWTAGHGGRLELWWALETERPAQILITRKRGSDG